MFYIHQASCISPQQTFKEVDLTVLHEPVDKRLNAIEPVYDGIPPGVLRRMSKLVRMGVAAAMHTLQNNPVPNGIIMGSLNTGKDDAVKFLNQIIDYEEGMLTPMSFVQSTPNAVAAQVALLTRNHGYNISHLHMGVAFEMAAIDADMMLQENPSHHYLLGAVDDMASYYFDEKGGWHKEADISNKILYDTNSPGSISGEGAAMFFVNNDPAGALAKLVAVDTLHDTDEAVLKEKLDAFLTKHLPAGETIDLLLSGENGDNRLDKYYAVCESSINEGAAIARFKHVCGEYATAASIALWLCCKVIPTTALPGHMIKKTGTAKAYRNILIYNNYKLLQHSFMLVSIPN